MKGQRGVEVYLYSFFNLTLDREGVQRHGPATAEIQERYPFREGCVDLRNRSDEYGKFGSQWDSIPGTSNQ